MPGNRMKAGVEIDGRGVKAPGTQVNAKSVSMNRKPVMAGVQYTGHKQNTKEDGDD